MYDCVLKPSVQGKRSKNLALISCVFNYKSTFCVNRLLRQQFYLLLSERSQSEIIEVKGERSSSHLVVTDLFGERLSALLQQVMQTHLVLTNQSLHIPSLLLPLVAVADHVVKLQKPRLHAVLCAVPLATDLLH